MKRVDVVVIGASLAGSACVRELNRCGVDALAIDRAAFPSDKVCGGFLSPGAVALLDEMDLLTRIRVAGAVEIRKVRLRAGDDELLLHLPSSGLAISRRTLDAIVVAEVPRRKACVERVLRKDAGFRILASGEVIDARVVVDASGKLSRLSRGHATRHFGVQFYDSGFAGGDPEVLEFWFFRDGYGGVARVENNQPNACFLIDGKSLPSYLNKPGCRVTGPLTYVREPFGMIAVGDAAGMIDPFCGEGMRHALDTGRMAARMIAEGLGRNDTYDTMVSGYVSRWKKRWASRRRLAGSVRGLLRYPRLVERGLQVGAGHLMTTFWK